jgi:hypothetical protein
LSEIDGLLCAQLIVAWAGEKGNEDERRLGWWKTDLLSEFGGRDFLNRLLPRTGEWAALQSVREAARRTDQFAREQGHDADLPISLYSLDEESGRSTLIWARDRFPPHLRADLAPTNIRDVVHKRLLQKNANGEKELRKLFDQYRPDLKLYAYGSSEISPDEFVDVYPLLPGHIDLLLQITSALRARSTRSQGDDQAIRGLLQLLGELFREQNLADEEVGRLVTLDQIYEIQHTALDSDTQSSMSRILNECAGETDDLKIRAAKAVALLELIQENEPTTADLVARCLYDRLDRGDQTRQVTEALEWLKAHNLLGYSEKQGYKIQSTAGEEWERTKRDIGVSRDTISDYVLEALKNLLASAERPKWKDRPFPLGGYLSAGRLKQDERVIDPRDDASIQIDFRFVHADDRSESAWRERSKEQAFKHRVVWVCGDTTAIDQKVRDLAPEVWSGSMGRFETL